MQCNKDFICKCYYKDYKRISIILQYLIKIIVVTEA